MLDKDALAQYLKAFDLYQAAQFKEAIALLAPICEKYPEDKATVIILHYCEGFLEVPPPPGWDGVTIMKEK